MATQFSILAWRVPWTRHLVDYGPWGCKELEMTERLALSLPILVKCLKQFLAHVKPCVRAS